MSTEASPARASSKGATWRRQLKAVDRRGVEAARDALAAAPKDLSLRSELDLLCAQLTRRGYTLGAIGDAASVSASTTAKWVARVPQSALMGIVEDEPHNEPLAPHIATATERNVIPAPDTERLIELQLQIINAPGDRTASEGLDLLCAQLQKRGYTYQAIANVLDVSRQMVQHRASRVPEDVVAGIQTEAARKVPKPEKTKAERQWLSEDELARLVELRPLAQLRRGSTPKDSPVARAADDFSLILLEARERGVTEYTMAQQLDMTPAAVRFRLQRITGDLPPSMQPKSEQDKVVRDPFEGLESELGELRDLLREAEIQIGRGPNHPDRLTASRRFDEALTKLVAERQVPLGALAVHLGRSRSSLAMRIASQVGGDAASKILDSDSQQADDFGRTTGDLPDLDIDGAIRPDRPGRLTDFTPEATPVLSAEPPAEVIVDRAAQQASTARHHRVMTDLRKAVQAGGHQTQGWDVGQDVFFLHGSRLVNVEVKSFSHAVEQYRLGVGQLAEQMQHHLDHVAAGAEWYVRAGVSEVVGVLVVVSDEAVPGVWIRLAARLGIGIWGVDQALAVFADRQAEGLPPGVLASSAGSA